MARSGKVYDVAVIGAGVFGAWTAYELSRRLSSVLLIDAYGSGNSRSSSGGESRIIRFGYGSDEIYTRSAQRSLQLWQEFFADCHDDLFKRTGVLWLGHEEDPYPVRTAETLSRLGIPFDRLSVSDIAARYPQIGGEEIVWALHEPDSGILMARRAVQAVTRAAIKRGLEYLQTSILSPAGKIRLDSVKTLNGADIVAEHYVFACGPWLPKLFPMLLAERIRPTRQEVFFFGAPAGDARFGPSALPTLIDFKDEAYVLPDLESRGVKVAIDRHGRAFDPDNDNRVVSTEGVTEVRRYLARRMPSLRDAPVTESRVCQYENTSNGDFLIDRHPELANVWLVGGGSGHGFKHGPVVGQYVAARLEGITEGIEPRFTFASKKIEPRRTVF